MKRLQEVTEEKWLFSSLAIMGGVVREVPEARQALLLLHGFNERGRRIYRKLIPYLPENALIISPDGPFPMPRLKDNRMNFGHAWYFYDRLERKYYIDQELATAWLQELLLKKNPTKLPLTIIGFSQGGYLAPLLGQKLPETKLVIGIGCEFKDHLLPGICRFPLEAIHGSADAIITPRDALTEVEKLRARGMQCGWHQLENVGHEISQSVGQLVKELLVQHGA